MAISDESRHRLYGRLEEVIGAHEAATLMQHLPPVGWAEAAGPQWWPRPPAVPPRLVVGG